MYTDMDVKSGHKKEENGYYLDIWDPICYIAVVLNTATGWVWYSVKLVFARLSQTVVGEDG